MFIRPKIKKDNRGSTIVIVIIAIAFISILGAILLFTTYTGYRIKASQAVGENRFYDAETTMDEVRAGMQGQVSETIAAAYAHVMRNYDGAEGIDVAFIDEFTKEFINIGSLFPLTKDWEDYFDFITGDYDGTMTFDIDVLRAFIKNPAAAAAFDTKTAAYNVDILLSPIDADGDGTDDRYVISTVILKDLRVTHISADDYLSVVDTDIVIDMPGLSYSTGTITFGDISDFAFVATGEMTSSGTVTLDGSAYVGRAYLTDPAGSFNATSTSGNSVFISGGTVDGANAGGGDIFVRESTLTTDDVTVWANDIIVGGEHTTNVGGTVVKVSTPGTLSLDGNTYAAGNLELSGNGSEVTLAGRYFGFGASRVNPDESSSIIVNSRENTLDLTALGQLSLAGHSFVSAYGENIFTGQSMAVKSDQLAYLIPMTHIVSDTIASNPHVCIIAPGDDIPDYDIDYDTPLWGAGTKSLRDYIDPASAGGGIQQALIPLQPADSNQYLFYLFMRFPDAVSANEYFLDYFQYRPDHISGYVKLYLDDYTIAATNLVRSSGVTYTQTLWGGPAVSQPVTWDSTGASVVGGFAVMYADEYSNRRRTLTRDWRDHPATNPFEYLMVDTDPANRPPNGRYIDDEGKVRAYVDSTGVGVSTGILSSDVRLIISYGDVSVNAPFTGLILCDGNINIVSDVTSNATELRAALGSKHETTGERLGDYLNINIKDDTDDAGDNVAWSLSTLVHYENWKKE